MSRRCDLCGRGPQKVVRRSHSKKATNSRQYLNLQTKNIEGERKKICTKCLKTINFKGRTATAKTASKTTKK